MKIKSTKQFWWRFNYLVKNGAQITITDRTRPFDLKEWNRIESLVRKRIRWELGPEGYSTWSECGDKDFPTLARAYGIK